MFLKYKFSKQYGIRILELIILLLFTFLSGCKTSDEILNGLYTHDVIYYNSFETKEDTVGIKYFAGRITGDDASPGGGKRSLYVSGGCIIPHVVLPIPAQTDNGYYQLKCWGKALVRGGIVELSTDSSSKNNYISIFIEDKHWDHYQNTDSLYCPANTTMWISLISGGDNPGGMLVDQIEIVKIN